MQVIDCYIFHRLANKTSNIKEAITARLPDLPDIFKKWIGHLMPLIYVRIRKREFLDMQV